ncbi:hypothetical protein VCB98_12925 [Gammaproteobacteria bacterium AB-CW1]|uniref:Lipoprotein n=1 Tax=Natronospira elongata TaxID=3110268 RepID=A0AAP6JH22_9GAMM|nr:hypothetical protein [Gammaproteobacteria bacterium AB-CW1]
MSQQIKFQLPSVAALIVLIAGCSSTAPTVDDRGYVALSGQPSITFQTSGWSYTNTENPFILTPDYLTNAMVGFSRLEPGQPILRGGPPVPDQINDNTIKQAFEHKLENQNNLGIETKNIGSYSVVIASYEDEEKYRQEYGFELGGVLLHVIVVANHGQYARDAEQVARTAIESMVQNASRR